MTFRSSSQRSILTLLRPDPRGPGARRPRKRSPMAWARPLDRRGLLALTGPYSLPTYRMLSGTPLTQAHPLTRHARLLRSRVHHL